MHRYLYPSLDYPHLDANKPTSLDWALSYMKKYQSNVWKCEIKCEIKKIIKRNTFRKYKLLLYINKIASLKVQKMPYRNMKSL